MVPGQLPKSLGSFPNELLLQIASHCDVRTLLEWRRISSRFAALALKTLIDLNLVPAHVAVKSEADLIEGHSKGSKEREMTPDGKKSIRIKKKRADPTQVQFRRVRSQTEVELCYFIPEFMVIQGISLHTELEDRVGDTVRILKSDKSHSLYDTTIFLRSVTFSPNVLQLIEAMGTKPLGELRFIWTPKFLPEENFRALDACLSFFRAVRGTLRSFAHIEGPFSFAEVLECFNQVETARFDLYPCRMTHGGLKILSEFIEGLRSHPRKLHMLFRLQRIDPRVTRDVLEAWRPVNDFLSTAYSFHPSHTLELNLDSDRESRIEVKQGWVIRITLHSICFRIVCAAEPLLDS
ncbi:hypothetical protein L596_000813 [Steinernema carpocapsae]|uniref:F-box domain-containing protein n=1 Tax=Steinernema carpocapsae TaxID=34508 RepID=A0A4U8UKH6_STECR|nr:hypothetical protein L596_000813 [Steinernema carpocapsae]